MLKLALYTSIIFLSTLAIFAEKKSVHEITISGNDTMQFDVKNFEVTAGNDVKITFKMSENSRRSLWDTTLLYSKKE